MKRRLAAILAADVVGYSRLMGADEIATLKSLKSHQSELLYPLIDRYGGRVVKLTGDGMLVEFSSVVDALDCATTIQRKMRERNADVPSERRIEFRIGINLGDVIVDGEDIFGDGVNIAARVESLASPGGIAVTAWVKENVGNKLELTFEDTGEHALKNISRPVRVYNVITADVSHPEHVASASPRATARVSLAVLSFKNLGSNSEQDYFSEGIAEDILTELSRFKDLLVIARNSSFSFKGDDRGIQDIAKALNVDFIAAGSVRRAGKQVRVAVQLIDAASGSEVWAERYDRELVDIFAVQDEIVRTIVVSLEARLGLAIADKARARSVPSLAAYECLLLARKYSMSHDAERAIPYAERALTLDPDYSLAHSVLSAIYYVRWLGDPRQETLDRMEAAARQAVALDSSDSRAHAYLGMALTCKKQYDLARSHLERAISLNPSNTHAHAYLAEWLTRMGDANAALEVMDQLLRRDPIPPPWHWELRGLILLLLGRYSEALAAFARQPKQLWYVHGHLAICYAYLGRLPEARSEVGKIFDVMPDPDAVRNNLRDDFETQDYRDIIENGLRLAGFPD